jgi:O-succinylbenzoate synthase
VDTAVKIAKVQIWRYRLPFVKPLTFLGSPLAGREGFVLAVTGKSGTTGYGECAPLPGYSRESLSDALSQLEMVTKRLRTADITDSPFLEQAARLCEGVDAASVKFAVESALLSLGASLTDKPVAALLSADFALRVPVNALIESNENLTSRLAELAAHNCRAAKLKVGRRKLAEDIDTVRRVRDTLPPHIALRLDANRAWTMDEAVSFARGVQDCSIEYIEEPLRQSEDLPRLHAIMPNLPLAVDESVRDMSTEYIRAAEHFSAVVIKPTVIGGILRSLTIARACRQSGKKAVYGAAIESSLGLSMIAQIAATLIQDVPIGLDTARLFAVDLVTPSLAIENYEIDIRKLHANGYALNLNVLEEVSRG